MPMELHFLGTGGGRFVTLTQRRWTGGIRFITGDNLHLHLDPGPGALIYSIRTRLSAQRVGAILISHCHLDHYADAEVMIEAMTRGMTKKRGILVGSRSVLRGTENCGPVVSRYHREMPKEVIEVAPGHRFRLGDLNVLTTETKHSDPDAVGFLFETPGVGDVGYTSDTVHFKGIGKYFRRVRLLILCVLRPHGKPWKGHMTTDDAIRIIKESKPDGAIITHFGMSMLNAKPEREASLIERDTGVPTVDAKDRMRVTLGEDVEIYQAGKKITLV